MMETSNDTKVRGEVDIDIFPNELLSSDSAPMYFISSLLPALWLFIN